MKFRLIQTNKKTVFIVNAKFHWKIMLFASHKHSRLSCFQNSKKSFKYIICAHVLTIMKLQKRRKMMMDTCRCRCPERRKKKIYHIYTYFYDCYIIKFLIIYKWCVCIHIKSACVHAQQFQCGLLEKAKVTLCSVVLCYRFFRSHIILPALTINFAYI